MEFEENEFRYALWAMLFHVISWAYLCYLREKEFTMPKPIGYLTFNILFLSHIYLASYMLTANTVGDVYSKVILSLLFLSDALFGFLYVLLNHYIYPAGYFGFTFFPKIFFVISLYFYFDNRIAEILSYWALTSVLAYF